MEKPKLNMYEDRRIVTLTKFCNLFREGAMWILFAIVFIIIVNIIMRRVFNAPIFGVTEIVKYVMLVCASLSLVENEWVDGNISMKLIPEKLGEKARSLLFSVVNFLMGLMMVYITYLLLVQTTARFSDHTSTPEWGIPMWFPESVLVLGSALLTIGMLSKAVLWAWMWSHGQYVNFVQIGLRQLRDIAVVESDTVDLLAEDSKEVV